MNSEYFVVWLPVALSAVFSLIGFFIAKLSAKPKVDADAKRPVPPEHIDAAVASAVLNGGELNCDKTALLIMNLAFDGYLKIRPNDQENPYDLTLMRVRDYDGGNAAKARLMDILFADGRKEVSTDELYDHIDGDMADLAADIRKSDRVKRLFSRAKGRKGKTITFLQIAAAVCLPLAFWAAGGFADTGLRAFFVCVGAMLFEVVLNSTAMRMNFIIRILVNGLIAAALGTAIVPGLMHLVDGAKFERMVLIVNYGTSAMAIVVLGCFRSQIDTYSAEGEQIYQKLMELEHYLEQADNRNILLQLQRDPDYCYRMLPYAAAMNCSALWFERFADLPLSKPVWYDDSSVSFSRETFLNFLARFEDICYYMTDHFDDTGSPVDY